MDIQKKKVLLLSTHDSHLGGHAWDAMKLYDNSRYDVKLLTLYSLYGKNPHAFFNSYFLYRVYKKFLVPLFNLFTWGSFTNTVKDKKYSFLDTDYSLFSAKQILKKYGSLPDIIVLHWFDGFVTAKVIRELYKLSGAKIVFVFTDEFPLGGGCHYPCNCLGYTNTCEDCPAVRKKIIPQKVLRDKIKYLRDIPKIVIAPTAGIKQAQESAIFGSYNTQYIKAIRGINIETDISVEEARSYWGIPQDKFVIMFGALDLMEERKGMQYLLKALNIFAKRVNQEIIALVPGKTTSLFDVNNISMKYLGVLDFENLCKVYKASNVYISPSIADAGPMMVKYSIACGTPVIAFPVGYSLDFIQHKQTGYLVKMMEVEDLAEGIYYFFKNQQRQIEFYKNCISLNRSLCKNESVYNTL